MFDENCERNLSMLLDFYELTMANGYLASGYAEREAVFDMFYRNVPDNGGFAIFAGLEQLVGYLEHLSFNEGDIEYLRGRGMFSERFLSYLANFKFCCDVWAVREGTPIFPNEPIITVRGPILQAQLLETMILLSVNHQSLIATKANRIVRAAQGRPIMEFGSRRAQGYDGAVLGARAAYIGGCAATACVLADRLYGIPAVGTMAHSWVQAFDSEYEAFATYAQLYPDNCTLLIDTYDTLRSGVPNAIKTFNEVILPTGHRPKGVRIDSGDIAYQSKEVRKMLDAAGFEDVLIVASNSLDEYIIRDLLLQGAKVDTFGVGESLITSKSSPVFGGVYKLVALREGDVYEPKIKISASIEKITTPGFKKLYRLYDGKSGRAVADYITLHGEVITPGEPLTIFDPNAPWKRQTLEDFTAEELMVPVFEQGRRVYDLPSLEAIRAHSSAQIARLWDEVKRFEYPHKYYVDYSQQLWDMRQELLVMFG